MLNEDEKNEEYQIRFLIRVFISILILPIVVWIWPSVVPFGFFDFWEIRGAIFSWLSSAWPIFIFGLCVAVINMVFIRKGRFDEINAGRILAIATAVSTITGFVEEVSFRWLFFLSGIIIVKIGNFLFFGFLGFGIAEWLHMNIIGPIINLVTLHYLEPYIFHYTGWAVGAAMLATNAFFSDGHRYQGFFGRITSWFVGMYLFWIMFQYGLLAAILIHFLHNFLIYTACYMNAIIERFAYDVAE